MKQQKAPTIRATRLGAEDAVALAEFHRQAWHAPAPGEGAASATADTEGGKKIGSVDGCPFTASLPAPAVGVYDGPEIIGYLSSIPAEFWNGERSVPAHWLKGFMVLESRRNGPIGFMLAKKMADEVGHSGAMVVASNARRLFEALGYHDAGAVPNFLTVTRPVKFLRALDIEKLGLASLPQALRRALRTTRSAPVAGVCGIAAGLALGTLTLISKLVSFGLRVRVTADPPAEALVDPVWARLRAQTEFAPSRSGAYLSWRYSGENSGRYEFLSVYSGTRLRGVAVVRRSERDDDPRLAGLRLGLIVDLVVDPSDKRAIVAVLVAARSWGRRNGCDAVLLTLSHRKVGSLAIKVGYARIPGNVHCLLRSRNGEFDAPKGGLGKSWLTRGDAWGDDI
jgi:hypothetical protein